MGKREGAHAIFTESERFYIFLKNDRPEAPRAPTAIACAYNPLGRTRTRVGADRTRQPPRSAAAHRRPARNRSTVSCVTTTGGKCTRSVIGMEFAVPSASSASSRTAW